MIITKLTPDKNIKPMNGPTIFLAGPTPRDNKIISWRKEVLNTLYKKLGDNPLHIDINIAVPERSDWSVKFDYNEQIEWELEMLGISDIKAFWIPRSKDLPGFTTNVEFGMAIMDLKSLFPVDIVYGRPDNAENIKYIDVLYKKVVKRKPSNTIDKFCDDIINSLEKWC